MAKKGKINNILLPAKNDLTRLLAGRHSDPHSILGMHSCKKTESLIVRCFDPQAHSVSVLFGDNQVQTMEKIHQDGLFATRFKNTTQHFEYRLQKEFANDISMHHDPYCFMPGLGELDTHLFNEGEHRQIYNIMGAHLQSYGDISGVLFAVWAPNAERLSVVGDFNCWDGRRHPMRIMGNSGIWELFIPGLVAGDVYKFEIRAQNGDIFLKLDPYAYRTELRPNNAAVVASSEDFAWSDCKWMTQRAETNYLEAPVNIYEVHLASWCGPGLREIDRSNENDFHSYRELAHSLADYLLEMNYTHVQLLPVSEHPLDQSWGYQVTGFYAPTARFGEPEEFAYFVNHMHEKNIGVLLDWVPAHFPKDAFSLGRFDGTALYEHADPRQGEHRDWGTYIFNFGRNEVRNFLLGNALYWMDKYHIDGLRVDAVASMLYLDYSKEDGDWIPNQYGGNENLDAISFLKRLNELTHELHPGSMMIAEESTAWPAVSKPVYLGGLGFSYKWNMGWMHDTLEYFSLDPVFRSYNHGRLTFSLLYAFSENFILPLSHDEVVHGKGSIVNKMPGDEQQQFANLRSLYTYMLTHPGKNLLFMGSEFGQRSEWNCEASLDWYVLQYPIHNTVHTMLKELNSLYKETPSLWEDDFTADGFEWIDGGDYQQSVFSYIRWDKARKIPVIVVINLTPIVRENYKVGVPFNCEWEEIFTTDNCKYGGSGLLNSGKLAPIKERCHGKNECVELTLPWLGAVILKPVT